MHPVPSLESLRRATEQINTSHANPEATRALVVWNPEETFTGELAVFHAEYWMKRATKIVGVDVHDGGGVLIPSALRNLKTRDAEDENAAYHVVIFDLAFKIKEIAPRSWATYFASYAAAANEMDFELDRLEKSEVVVIETLCHAGSLPAHGSFDKLSPFMLY